MILSIDSIAERYKMLPTQVLSEASTFDMYVFNTAQAWRAQQNAYAQAGVKRPVPHASQDELKAMMKRAKEIADEHKSKV
jgi:hypothetical protein